MFALTPKELSASVLDCGGGPASFAAEMHRRGNCVVSCDPLYELSADKISKKIEETYPQILEATKKNVEHFVWAEFGTPEGLGEFRRATMRTFLQDFPEGLKDGRYRTAALPTLPFRDRQFDLALCSHLLFTYSDALSFQFHVDSIRELCRVATEARIFPLLAQFGTEHSAWLAETIQRLEADNHRYEIIRVAYEFQKGGNEMLRVWRD